MKFDLRDITKLPNILTLVRIALIPVFVWAILWEDGLVKDGGIIEKQTNGYMLAAVIVIISGLTDAADGFIARRFNMITDLGKALDPLADKLTQAAVIVCLCIRYRSIWWMIAALLFLVVGKEITMLVVGLLFLKKGQDLGGAKWFGKATTIIFYLLAIALIGVPRISQTAAMIMIGVIFVMNAAAFILYMREYFRLYKQRGTADDKS